MWQKKSVPSFSWVISQSPQNHKIQSAWNHWQVFQHTTYSERNKIFIEKNGKQKKTFIKFLNNLSCWEAYLVVKMMCLLWLIHARLSNHKRKLPPSDCFETNTTDSDGHTRHRITAQASELKTVVRARSWERRRVHWLLSEWVVVFRHSQRGCHSDANISVRRNDEKHNRDGASRLKEIINFGAEDHSDDVFEHARIVRINARVNFQPLYY